MSINSANKAVFTVSEAADYLGLATSTLNKWRCYHHTDGPPFLKLGKAVRYRKEDLDAYLGRMSVGSG